MTHDIEHDFDAFEDACRQGAAGFFTTGASIHVARAPGRLDVMGGIADYSGSLVAEMPIAQAAVVGAEAGGTPDGSVIVRSANAAAEGLAEEVSLPAELFINPVSLLRHLRDAPRQQRWAGYLAGCLSLLRAEGLVPRGVGAKLFLRSDVPLGAGVASSAAVEVAAMRSLCAAFGVEMDGLTLARLCQRAENDVMDAPCGIMDQVTSALGEAGKLLLLLCQPYQVQGAVALPEGWSVFGIDSGVKHSVGGTAYARVRVAAFMGFKVLADRAGSGFGGYLCNVSPDDYHALMPERLPETMTGAAFLGAHGGIFDTVTAVDPHETYPVRAAAEHAIYENARVHRFVECLRIGTDEAMFEAGVQMIQSHHSYAACDLDSDETYTVMQVAISDDDVAGAKITGGGSGGTVCVLCRAAEEERIISQIRENIDNWIVGFNEESSWTDSLRLIRGTSPGAMATEVRVVRAQGPRH